MYIIDKTQRNREADMQELRKDYREATGEAKEIIERTARNISNESLRIKSMREALLKAHKRGDIAEIKDIHEYIRNKREYRNG